METNHLFVEFYADAVHSKRRSEAEGRPIYVDREMVHIRWPGDSKRDHHAPADEKFKLAERNGEQISYAEAFPEQYAAFKNKAIARKTGTPLNLLPFLKPTQIRELEHANVFTAEALAALPDGVIRKMGGQARAIVDQTKDWIAQAEDAGRNMRLAAENDDLKARIAKLEKAMAAQEADEPAEEGPDGWTDEQLREHLTEAGAPPRANAARSSMIAAVKEMMSE